MKKLSQQTAAKETTRVLLQDTFARLSGQLSFLEHLEKSYELPNNQKSEGVIRATTPFSMSSKDLLDWKGHLQKEKQEEMTLHQAKKMFRNLRVLHSDTLLLTEQLLNSNNIWSNFNPASQALIASSMEQIRSRHATTLETMADIVIGLRPRVLPLKLLNAFLRGRLAVQILCDHYVALHNKKRPRPNGAVSVNCSLEPVLEEAMTEAKHLCDAHYLVTPELVLPTDHPNLTLIRPWVHHALVEVLKNAMVSSIESSNNNSTPPPILIRIENGCEKKNASLQPDGEYCSIHIEDHGVGISDPAKAFQFASVDQRWDRLDVQQSYAAVRSPLQSLGVGAPSSRWLMQHFGGDLQIFSSGKGKGCTAILRLPYDDDIEEFLPINAYR